MPQRRLGRAARGRHASRSRARPAGAIPLLAGAALALLGATPVASSADCVVVRERTPRYTPHVALHFGSESDVPRNLVCASTLDHQAASFCIPIWAYNLRDGAQAFELALRLPRAPLGFDVGPAMDSATLEVAPGSGDVVAGLHVEALAAACGPVLLGCMRLPTAELPQDFQVVVELHPQTNRRAARDAGGTWWPMVADAGGARIGASATCPRAPCKPDYPVTDLASTPGDEPGALLLSWRSGSGSYTLLCARTDGRYPADPWDGDFLALLPSDVVAFEHRFLESGTVHIAAWSVTRGPFGTLHSTSNSECGALTTALVDLPVGVSTRSWGNVKTLYR